MKKKENLNLVLFRKEGISRILKLLKIDMRKKHFCSYCGKKLNKKNVGNISYYNKKIYCDNPICFPIDYLRNKRNETIKLVKREDNYNINKTGNV